MDRGCGHLVRFIVGLGLIAIVSPPTWGKDFYQGKTIRFVVGYAAGGSYDTYARTVAHHMRRHIPGKPSTVVENMTGGGSLIAAHYLYHKAKPDGLTIGIWNSQFILLQALGDSRVKLDGRRIGWIGAPSRETPACAIMAFTGLKSLKAILSSKKPVKVAGTRAGTISVDLPEILNRTLGTKFKIMTGYQGTLKYRLAMQAREVDGACWSWESMRTMARAMLDAKGDDRLIPFIIHRRWNDPEVKDLPLIPEVIKGDSNLATYNAWSAPHQFSRPFTLPPGTPGDRLKILREAFTATLKDGKFLQDARKSRLNVKYVAGKQVEKLVHQILSMPEKAKQNLRFLVREKKKP